MLGNTNAPQSGQRQPADYRRGGTRKWGGIGMKSVGGQDRSPRQPIMIGFVVSRSGVVIVL